MFYNGQKMLVGATEMAQRQFADHDNSGKDNSLSEIFRRKMLKWKRGKLSKKR